MIGRSFVDAVSGLKITCNSLDQPEYPLSTGIRSFENAALAELPYLGSSSTLGCELQFVQLETCQVLADPAQSQPLLLCDCSAVFSRGSTQRADQRGSQGNQSAAR